MARAAPLPLSCSLEVHFPSAALAEVALRAVAVDAELRPDVVSRALSLRGAAVCAEFRAADVKSLRVAVSSLLDMLHLSARTIEAFAPPSLPAAQSA